MVRNPDWKSVNLKLVLSKRYSIKIFHHALFDLKRLYANMGVICNGSIECTKTLMKITHPELSSGLQTGLRTFLNINISKAEQTSDWSVPVLTDEQKWYAAGDVIYLNQLFSYLVSELRKSQEQIYNTAISAIQKKTILEVQGYYDLLDYDQEKNTAISLANRNWWTRQLLENGE